MTQSKKYDYRVTQDNASWTTEIIRRVTSKVTVVSKRQDGFATEADAQEWGQKEVKAFLQKLNLNEQKKRRSRQPDEGNMYKGPGNKAE